MSDAALERVIVREAVGEDAGRLALVSDATFLETFAGMISGDALVTHCQRRHAPDYLRQLLEGGCLHGDCLTVTGKSMAENLADVKFPTDQDVVLSTSAPLSPTGGLVGLKGNLAPGGAIIKSSAADPKFLRHEGPALVFDDPGTMMRVLDDPDLDVTEDTVLVLRNAGPVGAPGMPEWGNLPIPSAR